MTHSAEKDACTCDSRRVHYHRAALAKAWEQGHEAGFHYAVRHEELANPHGVLPPEVRDA